MEEFDAEEVPGEWDRVQRGVVAPDEELEAATSEEKGH
jgi:hypothetical protein